MASVVVVDRTAVVPPIRNKVFLINDQLFRKLGYIGFGYFSVGISGSKKVFQSEIVSLINQILLGPARYRNMYTPLTGFHQIGIFCQIPERFLIKETFLDQEKFKQSIRMSESSKQWNKNKNLISSQRYYCLCVR